METLPVGTRVYNRGDMANAEHFGAITSVRANEWGTQYEITPDPDSESIGPYWVPSAIISPVDLGNGLSRIVTEEEHKRRRAERIANLVKACKTPHPPAPVAGEEEGKP